jgi:hypothetical protein
MRKILHAAALILFGALPAYAQVGLPWPGPGGVASGGGGGYVGPCDTSVAGAGGCSLFYGLRAATASYAASLGAFIDWSCTGGFSGTLHSNSSGDANATELATIASNCGSNNVFVSKAYEQITGTANAIGQTLSGATGLRFFNSSTTCKGLARCLYSGGTFAGYNLVSATVNISAWSAATVNCWASGTPAQTWMAAKSGVWAIGHGSSANQAGLYAGSGVVTATQSDCDAANNIHSTIFVQNGASSCIVVDGTATCSLNPGSNALVNNFSLGNDDVGTSPSWEGPISETAIYPIVLASGSSAGQYGKVCNNQRLYWGTGGSC